MRRQKKYILKLNIFDRNMSVTKIITVLLILYRSVIISRTKYLVLLFLAAYVIYVFPKNCEKYIDKQPHPYKLSVRFTLRGNPL